MNTRPYVLWGQLLSILVLFVLVLAALSSTVGASVIRTSHVPTDGLVAHWSFDDGTATDNSGNGHDGNLYGSPDVVEGIGRSALRFDGVDDYIEVLQGLNFEQEFTYCSWIKPESSACVGNGQLLFQKGQYCPDGNPNYQGLSYSVGLGGQYTGAYTSSGCDFLGVTVIEPNGNFFDDRIIATSLEPIVPDNDYLLCVSYQNTSKLFELWLNGEQIETEHFYERGGNPGTTEIDPQDFSHIHQTDATFKIGASESWCNYQHQFGGFFDGTLDEIRVYDRALNEAEIQALYEPSAPQLSLSPTTLEVTLLEGQRITETLTLSNSGVLSLTSHITDAAWLKTSPISGTMAFNQSNSIDVTIDATTLAAGTYTDTLIITSNDPDDAMVEVPVELTVSNGSSGSVILALDPPTVTTGIEQIFDLTMQIQADSQDVDAASAYLNFDPTFLEVVSIAPGSADGSGKQL